MDPTKCLEELLQLKEEVKAYIDGQLSMSAEEHAANVNDLVDHIEALDTWMKHGGFSPQPWKVAGRR